MKIFNTTLNNNLSMTKELDVSLIITKEQNIKNIGRNIGNISVIDGRSIGYPLSIVDRRKSLPFIADFVDISIIYWIFTNNSTIYPLFRPYLF